MAVYCVSYDLIKGKTYEPLHEKLKAYGTWAHALESTWFIVTEDSAAKIRDNLTEVTDEDDEFIVIEVIKHWASSNFPNAVTNWLKKNL